LKIIIVREGKETESINGINEFALVTTNENDIPSIRTVGSMSFGCLAGALLQRTAINELVKSEEVKEEDY